MTNVAHAQSLQLKHKESVECNQSYAAMGIVKKPDFRNSNVSNSSESTFSSQHPALARMESPDVKNLKNRIRGDLPPKYKQPPTVHDSLNNPKGNPDLMTSPYQFSQVVVNRQSDIIGHDD
jgi:hypothetical protein